MRDVLVVGSLNMDMTIYVDRIPVRGETVSGNDFLLSPGGKGANQAVAASRMGARVSMLGCVGDDVFGEALVDALEAAGVDTSLVDRLPGISTGVASITVCDGDNRIAVYAGANGRVSKNLIDRAAVRIRACDALVVQQEIPPEAVFHAVRTAHGLGTPVFLNPAPAREIPREIYPMVKFLLPNEGEAACILGRALKTDDDMIDALQAFRALGVAQPVITLGARGVACCIEGRPSIVKGYCVDAVDTTAAGDTFIGALAANLDGSSSFTDVIMLAQKAAALCVTRRGAQKTIPAMDEVRAWNTDNFKGRPRMK